MNPRPSRQTVGHELQQEDREVVIPLAPVGQAAMVIAIDGNDTSHPASKCGDRVRRQNADTSKGLRHGSKNQISGEMKGRSSYPVTTVECLHDRRGRHCPANHAISIGQSKVVSAMSHGGAHHHGNQIRKSDWENARSCTLQGLQPSRPPQTDGPVMMTQIALWPSSIVSLSYWVRRFRRLWAAPDTRAALRAAPRNTKSQIRSTKLPVRFRWPIRNRRYTGP